jgi:hypothetical protein
MEKVSIIKTDNIPENAMIQAGFGTVDYCDSYRITKPTAENAAQITAHLFTLPKWVSALMNVRNCIAKPFGLKTGDIARFPVIGQSENEMLMEGLDRHLNFRISVLIDREKSSICTTTLVHYNNRLGKVYFLFVKPFHSIIVRAMMKRLLRLQ